MLPSCGENVYVQLICVYILSRHCRLPLDETVTLHPFYLLEINFVHLESRLKDPWSQYSAPQQILVKRSDKCNNNNNKAFMCQIRVTNLEKHSQDNNPTYGIFGQYTEFQSEK